MIKICAILILWLSLFCTSYAQDLVAGVSIADGQNKINQLAVYRFTLIPEQLSFDAGTVIQTYLPTTIDLTLTTNGGLNICRQYIKMSDSTQTLTCTYDLDLRMVQFTIGTRTNFDVAYEYDIGQFKNPSVSSLVSGFRITVTNAQGQVLYDTTVDAAAVYIQPGDITGQSLSVSSQKVSDPCIYTFQFRISNPIPGDGVIQITFPTEVEVPTSIASSDTRIKIYNGSWQTGSITATTRSITFQSAFQGQALQPNNQFIFIEIQKVVNPKSLKQTSSFSIATMNPMFQRIDQATTSMTVQTTIPGDIQIFGVAPQTNPQVGQTTDINFNIQIAQAYDSGGYLLITFPSEVTIKTLTCFPFIGFVTQDSNCQLVSSSPQTVKILNAVQSTRLFFLISSVTNPSSTKATSTFKIQAYDSGNYLMSQVLYGVTYQATPASFKVISSTRSITEINIQTNNNVTFQFTTTNALTSTDQISIKIPYDQLLVNSTVFSCQAKTGTQTLSTQTCTVDTTSSTIYFLVTMAVPCPSGCPASTAFTIVLQGIRNPQWRVYPQTKSVEVQTMTSDLVYIKDRRITSLYINPDCTEGQLQNTTMKKYLKVVNQPTQLLVNFTLLNMVPVNGVLRVYFPASSIYSPASGSILCQDYLNNNLTLTCTSTLQSDTTKGIDYISITNKCTTQCAAATKISILISNVKNRFSIKPLTNAFGLRTFTQELYYIDIGNITNAIDLDLTTAAFSQLSLPSPSSPIIAGQQTTYQFKITTQNGIQPSSGQLEIFIPSEIIFTSASPTCVATANSNNLNCQINIAKRKIIISHSVSGQAFTNTQIIVTIANSVMNPQITKQSSVFVLQSSLYDSETSQYYLVDYDNQAITVTPDTPNTLTGVSITRTAALINQQSDFMISFNTVNPIPKGSLIIISFPKDQIIFQNNQNRMFFDASSGSQIQESYANGIGDNSLSYVSISLVEWCSLTNSLCPALTSLQIQLTGVYNPPNTKPPNLSFQIKIQTPDSYLTDQKLQDTFATPLLSAGPFQSIQIKQSSLIVGDTTSLTFEITLSNQITSGCNGALLIKFPTSMFYTASTTASCSSEGGSTNCTKSTATDSLGEYYSQFNINLNCQTLDCSRGKFRVIKIDNLKNRFSVKPFYGQFQMVSLDDDNLTFDASTVDTTQTTLQPQLTQSHTGQITDIQRSNMTVSQLTDIKVSLKTAIRLSKNSMFQLYLPKDQIILQNQLTCYNQASNQQIDCTLNSTINDPVFQVIQFKEFCNQATYCPDNQVFMVNIRGFKNRYNTQGSQNVIQFKTYTPEQYIVEESNSQITLPDNLQPTKTIVQSNYTLLVKDVGQTTSLQMSFILQNNIKMNEWIKVEFSSPIFLRTSFQECEISGSFPQNSDQDDGQCDFKGNNNGEITQITTVIPFDSKNTETITLEFKNIGNILQDKPWNTTITVTAYTSDKIYISQGALDILQNDILNPISFRQVDAARSSNDLKASVSIQLTLRSPINILQNSFMMISVPLTQFTYIDDTPISCYFANQPLTCSLKSQDLDYYNIQTSTDICKNSFCQASQAQNFTISGFINPSMITPFQKSFKLLLNSSDNYQILNSKTLSIIAQPPIKIGAFKSLIISQTGSLETGLSTSYDINFQFPTPLPNDNKLYVRFATRTVSQIDNTPIKCQDKNSGKLFLCNVTSFENGYISVISIDNFCQVTTCDDMIVQKLQISDIKNVEVARPRNTMIDVMAVTPQFYVVSTSSFDESSLPAFQVRKLTTLLAERETSKPGDNNIDLTIAFTTLNKIPDGSVITYYIPFEQVYFSRITNLICMNRQGSLSLDCDLQSYNETFLIINVNEWCSGDCQIGTELALRIKRSTNPSSLDANQPNNSFGVSVQSKEGYGIEAVYQGVVAKPYLDGILLKDILVSRELNMVGADDNMMFIIQIPTQLSISVSVQITLPQNVSYQSASDQQCLVLKSNQWQARQCAYYTYQNDIYGLRALNQVVINDVCTVAAPCNRNQNLIIKFKISNSRSQLETNKNQFKITLLSDNFDVGQGLANYSLTQLIPNKLEAQFVKIKLNDTAYLECYRTGEPCAVQINITTSNPIMTLQQWIQIDIPTQMSLMTASSCQGYLFDQKVICRIINSRQIQVFHQINTFDFKQINYQMQYRVYVTSLKNPYSTQQTDSFIITSYQKYNNNLYKIDELKQSLTYKIDIPSPFLSTIVTRNHNDLDKKTALLFQIQNENYIPNNAIISIRVPSTQILIIPDAYISCFKGISISNNNDLQCQKQDDNTVLVTGLCNGNGCNENSNIAFGFAESFILNPPYQKDPLDSKQDSIQITSYYQVQDQTYLIDQTNQGILINPTLNLSLINLQSFQYLSQLTSAYQTLKFIANYQDINQRFTSNYLRIRFNQRVFNYDSYQEIQIDVNNQTVNLLTTKKNDDSSIDYIIFECSTTCQQQNSLNISLHIIKNPYFVYKSLANLNTIKMSFSELYDTPDKLIGNGNYNLFDLVKSMSLAPIKNTQLYQLNSTPTANNTLDIIFSLENQPYIDLLANITIRLPSNFTALTKSPKCSTIFNNQSLSCTFANSTFTILNYFSNMTQSSAFNLHFSELTNPITTITQAPITISIESGNKQYAYDNQTLKLSLLAVSNQCNNSNCAQCTSAGYCLQCNIPSYTPLLQDGQCVEKCSQGQFEFNAKCYQCASGCQECQSFDTCSKCDDVNQVLIDGKCVKKSSTSDGCPIGTKMGQGNVCLTDENCQSGCTECGINKLYCYQCSQNKVSLNGQCVDTCPKDHFKKNGICTKCDSLCQTCTDTPYTCSSCRKYVYTQSILDLTKSQCVSSCVGSILRASEPIYCDPCDPTCFTCIGSRDNCTSCYYDKNTLEDLFFYDNKCLTKCPISYNQDYISHECLEEEYNILSLPPLFLISSILVMSITLVASKFTSKKIDHSGDIALVLLTQVEFLNRVFLLGNLWVSPKTFSFCVTGMNILCNSFLGIYFATLVVQPICNQLSNIDSSQIGFKLIVAVTQVSGINTIKLLTSRFFGLQQFSNKFNELTYYVKHLETISLMSTVLCLFQLMTGISCIFDFSMRQDAMGFGINAIIINAVLIGIQSYKYAQAIKLTKTYEAVHRS